MTMNALEDYLRILRTHKSELTSQFKVSEIGVFGSFARGEQSQSSDIDVLVTFDDDADLFDLSGLAIYLEQLFQRKVDIVSRRTLRAELRSTILQEVVDV